MAGIAQNRQKSDNDKVIIINVTLVTKMTIAI